MPGAPASTAAGCARCSCGVSTVLSSCFFFHADPRTGAVMTPAQAVEVGEALTMAAEGLTLHGGPTSNRADEPRPSGQRLPGAPVIHTAG